MLFIATLLLLTLTIFSSCQDDVELELEDDSDFISTTTSNDNSSRSYTNVDPSLWSYFQSFEEAAALRGYSINLNQLEITGELQDLPGENIGGQCTWHSNNPNNIIIDEPLFNELPDLYREFIIFHELGHCVLNRDHREDVDGQGNCLSLMRSGLESCNDNYRINTRTNYLNELFDPNDF